MSRRKTSVLACCAGLLFLSIAGALEAQTPPSAQCGYMCHVPMAYRGGSGQMAPRGLGPVEGDFTQMKARFGITPAQEPAWQRFEDALNRPPPDPHQAMQSTPPRTSAERAKIMEQLWHQRYQQMQAVTDAFKELYMVLDENQQGIADRRFGFCELVR